MSGTAAQPNVPDRNWTNPFKEGTWLHDEFGDVVREERDIIIIIDDYLGRRGTGKTIGSLNLGENMDQNGGVTSSQVTLQPEEFRQAYFTEPERSAIVLDEGEVGASNRDAMTKTNKILREIMSMGRVEQKYVIINTPIKGFIDSDLQKLADVWISMTRRGRGLVHHLRWHAYAEKLLTPKKQWIEFTDVPKDTRLREVYNQLTAEKRDRIEGEVGESFITQSEHKEILKRRVSDAEKDVRNDILWSVWNRADVKSTEVTQSDVADAVGLSQPQVSNIVGGQAD